MKSLGLDEAGRSPIIGSISIGGVIAEDTDNIDAKDSKKCTQKELKDKFKEIKQSYSIYNEKITPTEIDTNLPERSNSSYNFNLNDLEVYYMLKIIKKSKPDKIFIDNMDKNRDSFFDRVRKIIRYSSLDLNIKDYTWKIKHELDENSNLVGAASIVAKHFRDKEIENLKADGELVGSGQVSDPTTQKYVFEHLNDNKETIRYSWKTIRRFDNNKVCSKCGSEIVLKWGNKYKCSNCRNKMNG